MLMALDVIHYSSVNINQPIHCWPSYPRSIVLVAHQLALTNIRRVVHTGQSSCGIAISVWLEASSLAPCLHLCLLG